MVDNKIHIFFASDDNFALPLTIALSSILRHANSDDEFCFYILDKNISLKNKNKIQKLKKIKNFEIEYIQVDDKLFANCPLTKECKHISLQTYYRYLIPIIKPNLEKILYLDCDILVVASLKSLWNIDLKNTYCGVVEEMYDKTQQDAKRLNIKSFFNAGVLLINNKKWVDENISNQLFSKTKELYLQNKLIWQDQDVLNAVFNDNVTWINPKYNFQQNFHDNYTYTVYSTNDIENAEKNNVIIHYNTYIKPWKDGYKCNFKLQEYIKEIKLNGFWYVYVKYFFNKLIRKIFYIRNIKEYENKIKLITILGLEFNIINIHDHKQISFYGIRLKFKDYNEQKRVTKYLKENYILPYFQGNLKYYTFTPKQEFKNNKIIWQYWGQGINQKTPKIVRKCLESVDRNKQNYTRILLTNDNIADYIDLPEFVCKKLQNGTFSYTFFSDLLRCCLLSTYGGIWIDATIFLTSEINPEYLDSPFFIFQRQKQVKNKKYFSQFDNLYFSWNKCNKVKWLSSFIVSQKENRLINVLKDLLLNYWDYETDLKYYFLMHLIFSEITKKSQFKNYHSESDTIPHLLQINLKNQFDIDLWKEITQKTSIHKLTYKIDLDECSENSFLSFILKS